MTLPFLIAGGLLGGPSDRPSLNRHESQACACPVTAAEIQRRIRGLLADLGVRRRVHGARMPAILRKGCKMSRDVRTNLGRRLGRGTRTSLVSGYRGLGMVRSDLVQSLARDLPDLSFREVDAIVGIFFETITEHLARGKRVELRGLGAFSTRARGARVGRNPRTGDPVDVAAKNVPYFKPGKEMRALN
jgi:integration host factor subunit beta